MKENLIQLNIVDEKLGNNTVYGHHSYAQTKRTIMQ